MPVAERANAARGALAALWGALRYCYPLLLVLLLWELVARAGLIRALAETLRGKTEEAEALRSALAKAVMPPELSTAFDVFGSELPDDAFTGVFDQPRQRSWRKVDL